MRRTPPSHQRQRRHVRPARARPRLLGMVAAGVAALASGCAGNHDVFSPHGAGASRISTIGWVMVITSGAIAVFFLGLLVWALVRGGVRPPWRAENGLVVAGGILLPVAVIVALSVLTLNALNDRRPAGAEHIEVVGHQFWWEIVYTDRGAVTANELRIPVDRPVDITLRSADVIHSFWVPGLDGKIDMVPGQTNHLTIQAHDLGDYRGQCAEYCGIQHAWMIFSVQVTSSADYESWVAQQAAPAAPADTTSQEDGQRAFSTLSCASCHTIRGTDAHGTLGPDLTHLASRSTLGAGVVPNDRGHLGGWIANSQAIKPGNLMPAIPMQPDQLQSLLDYLQSLR
jgi:cytochrome c oxidase subunit II